MAFAVDLAARYSAPLPSVVEQLESQVRSSGPLRRALAALAGRFVALEGWERLGYVRLGDYAVERLGLSAREIEDLARVDRALADLPRVEAALVSGRISWTKTRLLARVADCHCEEDWVRFAERSSVRELERSVRAIDRGCVEARSEGPDAVDEERGEGVAIRCTPEVLAKWNLAWRLARRVAGSNLPRWACMEAVAAEVVSAVPLDDGPVPEGPAPPPGEDYRDELAARRWRRREERARARWRAQSDGPVGWSETTSRGELPAGLEGDGEPMPGATCPWIRSLVRDLASADAFELDARLRRAVTREQRREATMAPLLLRVAEERLYRATGQTSLEQFARERLEMAPSKVWALLRLERAGRDSPALLAAYRSGRLSWVKAHALVKVVRIARAHDRAWVDWADRVTVRRLLEDVGDALVRAETDPEGFAASGGVPTVDEEADLQTRADPTRSERHPSTARETSRFFFRAPADVAQLFRAVVCTVRRRLSGTTGRLPSEGEAVGAMFDHAFEVWGALRKRSERRRPFERDGWRCAVPGCTSYRNLQDHHIVFRSRRGSHTLENRLTLCAAHHLRGVHTWLMRCTGRAPHRLRFELGVRRGQPPLAVYSSGDIEVLNR